MWAPSIDPQAYGDHVGGSTDGWGPGEKVLSAYSYLSANVDSRVGDGISLWHVNSYLLQTLLK